MSKIVKNGEGGEEAGSPAGSSDSLEVRIATELLERAKTEGVSLVGSGGLLAGVAKQVQR